MWTIIFFTSWQCSSFVMGNDDWLSHLSDESQLKCEKSPPKSSKNEKLIFILRLTSDDWPSDPSNKSRPKCKKRPPKSSKNEMLVFGLRSNSDDQPSNPSNESQLKCDKMPPEIFIFILCPTSDDWPSNQMPPPTSRKNSTLLT